AKWGFALWQRSRASEKVSSERQRRGRPDATKLNSESEREALPQRRGPAADGWPPPELRPPAHSELRAPEQDRQRAEPVPRRLLPEHLSSSGARMRPMRLRLPSLAVCALAATTASSPAAVAAKPGAKQHRFPWHKRVQDA